MDAMANWSQCSARNRRWRRRYGRMSRRIFTVLGTAWRNGVRLIRENVQIIQRRARRKRTRRTFKVGHFQVVESQWRLIVALLYREQQSILDLQEEKRDVLARSTNAGPRLEAYLAELADLREGIQRKTGITE